MLDVLFDYRLGTLLYTINLKKGWNQIGDPFVTSVPVTSLTFGTGNLTYAQATAGPSPPNYPLVWSYAGGAASYTAANNLDPLKGYWIYAYQNTTMNVSVNRKQEN